MNITSYEADVVAWANQQAAFIRAGQFQYLDLAHIAEEIEDVGKSEKHELASRMVVLLAHLLKWQYQPKKRGSSWDRTIKAQRNAISKRLKATPSLKPLLIDPEWAEDVWEDAVALAAKETRIESGKFPYSWEWSVANVLQEGWLPTV